MCQRLCLGDEWPECRYVFFEHVSQNCMFRIQILKFLHSAVTVPVHGSCVQFEGSYTYENYTIDV